LWKEYYFTSLFKGTRISELLGRMGFENNLAPLVFADLYLLINQGQDFKSTHFRLIKATKILIKHAHPFLQFFPRRKKLLTVQQAGIFLVYGRANFPFSCLQTAPSINRIKLNLVVSIKRLRKAERNHQTVIGVKW
jgi:hypothetical protein